MIIEEKISGKYEFYRSPITLEPGTCALWTKMRVIGEVIAAIQNADAVGQGQTAELEICQRTRLQWQKRLTPRPTDSLDSRSMCQRVLSKSRISLAKIEEVTMTVTLTDTYEQFLADLVALSQLRPSTIRAYRYELAAAAQDERFQVSLDDLTLTDLEQWIGRQPAAPSTVGRRATALSRFFGWAIRHDLCENNPLAGRAPVRAP